MNLLSISDELHFAVVKLSRHQFSTPELVPFQVSQIKPPRYLPRCERERPPEAFRLPPRVFRHQSAFLRTFKTISPDHTIDERLTIRCSICAIASLTAGKARCTPRNHTHSAQVRQPRGVRGSCPVRSVGGVKATMIHSVTCHRGSQKPPRYCCRGLPSMESTSVGSGERDLAGNA